MRVKAEARRGRALEALVAAGESAHGPWSTTPFNLARQVSVDPEQVEALRAQISTLAVAALLEDTRPARRARSDGRSGDLGHPASGAPGAESASPRARAVETAIATACAGCRGWCCRYGGRDGAHLSVATLRRAAREVREDGSDPSADDLTDLYLSYLGATHSEDGCLFHGDRGCRLPRDLRSEVCNAFLCGELLEVVAGWNRDGLGAGEHAFVAVSRVNGHPRSVQSLAKAASKAD
ncbi:MAG: hypothetical protein HKO98_08710 [Gemmatimonadetes bacterium]|nr:hypothetical protein [Gemmatimonadota bacterium]